MSRSLFAAVLVGTLLAACAAPASRPVEPVAIPPGAVQLGSLAELEAAHLRRDTVFALTVTEAELNQRIAAGLARRPGLPVERASARLAEGEAELGGVLRYRGLELAPRVALRLTADAGQLRPEISRLEIGGTALPDLVTRALSDVVRGQVDQRGLTDRYEIHALAVRPGVLTIVARAR